MKNSTKIIVLWNVILFGFIFHSLIEMMPLFFGVNIAIPEATGNMPSSMAWMSLIFYIVPMLCIAGMLYVTSSWFKILNLILSSIFVLMNAWHLIEHIMEGGSAIQPILLSFILLVSILLFVASLNWKKEK